ncbi:MAG: hypothetical protein FWE82_01390 [Defluviitaleaceae bacterium]|nr:hypothetical protein [Defluviitaleaceae bacterium]
MRRTPQYEIIIKFAQKLFTVNEIYDREEIVSRICNATQISKKSFLPTDYCYNLTNKGRDEKKYRSMFEQIKRGRGAKFKYLGLDCDYKGMVQHFAKKPK